MTAIVPVKFSMNLILYKVNSDERVFLKGTVLFTFIFAHWWLISPIKSCQTRIKN